MVPEPQRSQLALLQDGLQGARWVQPEKLHITVRFVGEVGEATAHEIAVQLRAFNVHDFRIYLRGVGVFDPGNRPRSIWAAVRDPQPLRALHDKCNEILDPLGVMEERRKYLPHVSIARLAEVNNTQLMRYVEAHRDFATPPFWAEKFSLIRSHLTRNGAAYEILEDFPLRRA